MSSEYTEVSRESPNKATQASEPQRDPEALKAKTSADAPREQDSSQPRDSGAARPQSERDGKASASSSSAKPAPVKEKEVSPAKVKLQARLPALDDDAEVGVQKEQTVVRDGKADLGFNGTLVASAAPNCATKGHWQEYRVYETSAGKHVFSKVNRTVFVEEHDTFEAEVYDPTPSSATSQLLRSARDIARSRPLQWTDAAVAFFGYDPLAKILYRKIGGQFEEHIT